MFGVGVGVGDIDVVTTSLAPKQSCQTPVTFCVGHLQVMYMY